jgi:hypothetical protein
MVLIPLLECSIFLPVLLNNFNTFVVFVLRWALALGKKNRDSDYLSGSFSAIGYRMKKQGRDFKKLIE